MRFKKAAFLPCLLAVFLLTGCQNNTPEPDPRLLAAYLVEHLPFRDTLSPLSPEMTKAVYGFPDELIQSGALYVSSGATCEEVAVFKASEKAGVKELEKIAARRTEKQRSAFLDYLPEEVELLKSPYLRQVGNTLIYCVGADSAACDKAVDAYLETISSEK